MKESPTSKLSFNQNKNQQIVITLEQFKEIQKIAKLNKSMAQHIDFVLTALRNVLDANLEVAKYSLSELDVIFDLDPKALEKSTAVLKANEQLGAAMSYLERVSEDMRKGVCREPVKV